MISYGTQVPAAVRCIANVKEKLLKKTMQSATNHLRLGCRLSDKYMTRHWWRQLLLPASSRTDYTYPQWRRFLRGPCVSPDPTTFQVCWVQPIGGPEQVLLRWKDNRMHTSLDFQHEIRKMRWRLMLSPRPLTQTDSLAGFWGKWGERKGGTEREWAPGMGGIGPTRFGGKSLPLPTYLCTSKLHLQVNVGMSKT